MKLKYHVYMRTPTSIAFYRDYRTKAEAMHTVESLFTEQGINACIILDVTSDARFYIENN
ncbi:hypothetical protein [Listeria booriae]|uniref:hypothetical protein n=1 Tax=Listeria booriae TaxID=1552123 RepID=UPI001624CD01|nr:hypothetical protein [Listeria booriae]MBC1247330.1 hypothetical protein [Listeria booriae]